MTRHSTTTVSGTKAKKKKRKKEKKEKKKKRKKGKENKKNAWEHAFFYKIEMGRVHERDA